MYSQISLGLMGLLDGGDTGGEGRDDIERRSVKAITRVHGSHDVGIVNDHRTFTSN